MFAERHLIQSSQFIIQNHGKTLTPITFFLFIIILNCSQCLIEVIDFNPIIKNSSKIFLWGKGHSLADSGSDPTNKTTFLPLENAGASNVGHLKLPKQLSSVGVRCTVGGLYQLKYSVTLLSTLNT